MMKLQLQSNDDGRRLTMQAARSRTPSPLGVY